MDGDAGVDPTLVGDACHITGRSNAGPRGESELSDAERDSYRNLILLCKVHHKLVDDRASEYPTEVLQRFKNDHEKWVRETLATFDASLQRDREVYAAYVEEFVVRADLDGWRAWVSDFFVGGEAAMRVSRATELRDLQQWLFTRIWPKRYESLEEGFRNFLRVLAALLQEFGRHAEEEDGYLKTIRFYRIPEWNPEAYHRLLQEFEYHVDLVQDLALELTRAGNFLSDQVREVLDPSFRLREGALVVVNAFTSTLSSEMLRPEYSLEDRQRLFSTSDEFAAKLRFLRDIRMAPAPRSVDG